MPKTPDPTPYIHPIERIKSLYPQLLLTSIYLRPNEVEFRSSSVGGVRIVQVFLSTSSPRLKIWGESSSFGTVPIVLSIDEILLYCQAAKQLQSD